MSRDASVRKAKVKTDFLHNYVLGPWGVCLENPCPVFQAQVIAVLARIEAEDEISQDTIQASILKSMMF